MNKLLIRVYDIEGNMIRAVVRDPIDGHIRINTDLLGAYVKIYDYKELMGEIHTPSKETLLKD